MTILQNDRKEINDLIRGSEKIVEIYSGYQVLENKQRQKAYITIVTNETDGIKTAAVFLLWKCAGNCIGIYEIMSLKEGLFKIKVAMRPREKSSDKDKDKQKEKEKDKVTVFTEEVEPKEHITALKNKYGIETFEVEDTTTIKYMDQEILCIFNADGGARAFRERIREYIFPSADKELMEKQFQWINYYGTCKKMLLELGAPNGYQQGKSIVKIVDDSERFTRDLIGERLEMRKSEYTLENKVKIMIGTWNVAGNDPPENVDNWLFGDPELLVIHDKHQVACSYISKYKYDDFSI
ncbi:hypothetical protein AX774_g481 [Zancudomyces culisetae]|uniref:Uncharacterized protein n=1 Tax=Zancudomyces culisetae TaxID=1213189 RepID=A0A1R1PYD5_ZANCU|nr:hypothetical protein AX774_g481 [Zancudomyces culisetae]|eukprot:OMH85972.1 hypothetical protein AX774_g481 [Zancudomyces culisetae]